VASTLGARRSAYDAAKLDHAAQWYTVRTVWEARAERAGETAAG